MAVAYAHAPPLTAQPLTRGRRSSRNPGHELPLSKSGSPIGPRSLHVSSAKGCLTGPRPLSLGVGLLSRHPRCRVRAQVVQAVHQPYCVGDFYEGDEHMVVLAAEKSAYNDILVLEISRRAADSSLAGARVLLLDAAENIHSIVQPFQVWTASYYDLFALVPPLLPKGPVAILGLAGGTIAR
eukprot:TRINITY_DN2966_c0_g1_i4.p1 TRINITY_DN2966_c0_g1~~TRINITY_DN2966_c0_g1_i4.p1  ORF type:complete len:182 (+),score=17.84 TRINITY_DN2966_c0_g1_i4:241-786(+)